MTLARTAPVITEFDEEDDVKGIVIRSYTPVGSVSGLSYGMLQVEAREAIITDTNSASYFARFELSTGDDYPQTAATLVKLSDLDALIPALDRLATTNITTERFQFSEVEFEISGLSFIVFNNERGSMMFAVGCNGLTVHFNSLSKISEISKYVREVKRLLGEKKL
ncbi:hypothetical protein [Qipengyuania flava]|uniref:hypothetical protein n=1 Tax=Qipengyuania flava TaxID=192812 RepID=UPI001C632C3B|nr:hypothetical protein [Qipengyuania flava]QYJ06406.1 hypothetical protein KUV82_10005 [Qipengyuania flava]